MKREADEPLKVLESGRDERRKDDHRHCRNIVRLEDLFSIENANFQFKLMSEHALGLCSDLITFCERSGRWSPRALDKDGVRGWISTVDGTMEQPVQSTNI